jgi:antitoxin (DNA-binding transcriptional repressor) of toxin-antitoxin stability system
MSEKIQQPTENPTVKVTVVEIPVAELTALRNENAALKADNESLNAKMTEAANNAKMYESLYRGSQKDLESFNTRLTAIKNVLAI